jgi:hypothetical protein
MPFFHSKGALSDAVYAQKNCWWVVTAFAVFIIADGIRVGFAVVYPLAEGRQSLFFIELVDSGLAEPATRRR